MGNHVKTAAFATLAMAGILAVPAGAALNADKATPAARIAAIDMRIIFIQPDILFVRLFALPHDACNRLCQTPIVFNAVFTLTAEARKSFHGSGFFSSAS